MKFHINPLPNSSAVIEHEPFKVVMDKNGIFLGYTTDAGVMPPLTMNWTEVTKLRDLLHNADDFNGDQVWDNIEIIDMMSSDNDIHLKAKGRAKASIVMEYKGRHWNTLTGLLGTIASIRAILVGNMPDNLEDAREAREGYKSMLNDWEALGNAIINKNVIKFGTKVVDGIRSYIDYLETGELSENLNISQPIIISARALVTLQFVVLGNKQKRAELIIEEAKAQDIDAWQELLKKQVLVVHESHGHKSVLFTKSMIRVAPQSIGKVD